MKENTLPFAFPVKYLRCPGQIPGTTTRARKRHYSRCLLHRPRQIIPIHHTHLRQMHFHRFRRHQREESVHAVPILPKLMRESSQEELPESATESKGVGVALTVGETPRGEIRGSEIACEESVTASEGDSIAEDGTAYRVTCTLLIRRTDERPKRTCMLTRT